MPSIHRLTSSACLAVVLVLCLPLTACGGNPAAQRTRAATLVAPGPTVAVLGASDAYGIGTRDPDRENWPMQLAAELPQPTHLVNLAIPGVTLAQAQEEELPIALAQHPRVIVIWLVVNDIINGVPLATYSAELHATLAAIRAASPQTQVFVGNVPDLTQLPYFYGRNATDLSVNVSAWNAAIAQECEAEGAHLADLASAWGRLADHPDYISDDGLHPSDVGARALADFFNAQIRQTTKLNG